MLKEHCCIVELTLCTSQESSTSHVPMRQWEARKPLLMMEVSLKGLPRVCQCCVHGSGAAALDRGLARAPVSGWTALVLEGQDSVALLSPYRERLSGGWCDCAH